MVVPVEPPAIVRAPVQEGGSSSSGGQLPRGGDLLVTTDGEPLRDGPVLRRSQDAKKRGFAQRNEESLSSKRNLTDHFGIAAEEMRKRGTAERIPRETSMVPAVIAGAERGPEDQGDRESAGRIMATQEADRMEDVPPLNLERSKSVKRMAQGESKDEYQTDELKKGPRLSHPAIDD